MILRGNRVCRIAASLLLVVSGAGFSQPQSPLRSGMPVAPLPYATTSLQPFTHSHFPELRHPRIGLVLSGGGARGMSQIGVLQALEESGIRPDVVVGTSIGSIIGGLYASGYSAATLQSTIKTIDWNALLRLSNRSDREDLLVDQKSISDRSIISIRFDGLRPVIPISVLTGQLLANLLNELTLQAIYHATDFDDLGIPFRAIATDLYTGKRVILDHGSLAEAMRASATVPVLYDAVQRDSMALVDGGLRSNIPVDVARSMGCDIVIAVNTTSPQRTRSQITNPIEALDQVLNVLMERTNAEQLRLADIVITPDLQSTLSTSFDAPDSLIAQGYRAAMRILPDLRRRMQRCVDTLLPRALFAGRQFTVAPDSRPASLRASLGSADDGMALLRKLYASASEDSIANVFVTADSADTSMLHIDGVPYPRIRDVAFGGVRSIRTERLRQSTRAWIGAPVSARSTRRLCEGILHVYRDLGYSLASIDSVGIDTSSGRITVGVNEGEIGRIRVEGNVRTDTIVILRQFPMRGGEIFRIDDAREGLRNITGLNLFHQVSYDIIDTGGRPDVVIRLEERPSQSMHVSMLVNDERNAQLGIELRDANLFGTGTSLSGLFFGGIDNRQYSATYSTSQIFYTPFSLTLRSYYKLTDYNRYADDPGVTGERFARTVESRIRDIRIGGSASVGVYVQRFGMLSGTLRAENQRSRTFEFRQPGAPDLGEHGLVVSLSIGTTIDTQDRYPYPERGILMTAEYTSAQSALGSHVAFTRITAGYDVYIPGPTSRWTFHPRVRFGYGDRTLPRMEEFRLGGLYEFAGMRENEFTGQQLFVGSFETRYLLPVRMLFDTYLSVRYDLGRTWDIPEQIKFGELRHGVLAGLGLDTPIGPADFAVGKSFLFSSSGASSLTRWGPTMLYFSIGIGI